MPVRERDYFIAWLLFAVCSGVGGAIAGGIAGGLLGFMLGASGVTDTSSLRLAGGIAGFVVGLPISYGFFRLFVGIFIVKKPLERASAVQENGPLRQVWPPNTPGSQGGL